MHKLQARLHKRLHEYARFATLNNAVLAAAVVIALGWVWGSVDALGRNYQLQQQVNAGRAGNELLTLQNQDLQSEQNYLKTDEYVQLAARAKLNKALPGEKLLILPETASIASGARATVASVPASNFSQWVSFLFGAGQN